MAKLEGNFENLRKGETAGNIALVVCALTVVYFIVCFTVSRVKDIHALELATLISAPIILALSAGIAAYCNLKFGGEIDKLIKAYIKEVFVENAAYLHPDRKSLSFYLSIDGNSVLVRVNSFKEVISFDFSPLKKLSGMRKLSILTEIENMLLVSFLRLYERGSAFTDISWTESEGTRRRSKRRTYIINEGVPDKKSYRQYLKIK